jgi:hypothetical protein
MKLVFNSATGNVEDDFPADQSLDLLKRDVMTRLKLSPDEAGQYILACDGKTLDEAKTLGELEVAENSTLILWRSGAAATGRRTWDRSNEK